MKIIPVLLTTMALPLMALAQEQDQQQGAAQGQTNERHEKAAPQKKARHSAQEASKPESGATRQAATMPEHHTGNTSKTQATSSGHMQTKNQTTSSGHTQTKVVNKEEFKSSHQEVFRLGRHPKEFFIQRYGANHFRLIGNTYFVFVDGCWVSVDVAGFTFTERVICQGDPDYIVVY